MIQRTRQADFVPWPIKVGDAWRQSVAFIFHGGEKGHLDLSYSVEAIEDVITPAGKFDSFKVKGKGHWYSDGPRYLGGSSTPRSSGRAEVMTWYAIAAKREVRSEVRTWNPAYNTFDMVVGRELADYKPAPKGETTAK